MANTDERLVRIFGHRESLSLDARFRLRLPDDLVGLLRVELGRIAAQSNLPPAALQKLGFYLVPGTQRRIFLYPASNIESAIERFESPPPGVDPEELRAARDYFYSTMAYLETDKQGRLQIPDQLRQHAEIGEDDRHIVLMSHHHWLSIAKASVAEELAAKGREALDRVGPSVLDPVQPRLPAFPQDGA